MKCPYCGFDQDKVVDSRTTKEGRAIRRRRECIECGRRYTTYEYIETVPMQIIKSDGRKEPYDRSKLAAGVYAACKKRPVTSAKIHEILDNIESTLTKIGKEAVPSRVIGELVMKALQQVDEVAYMRFASVYRNFTEVSEFLNEIYDLHGPRSIKKDPLP